jgi:hypothetical protein
LKKASPWIRFLGILGFIGSGFMALGGVASLVLFPIVGALWREIPGFGAHSNLAGISLGLYLIFFAVLYFFPAFYTYNFGTRLRAYLQSGAGQDLETAFKNNKSLWKFLGIIAIIGLAFILLIAVIGIIAGAVSIFTR